MEQGDVLHPDTVLADFPLEVGQGAVREILVLAILTPFVHGEGEENAPDQ